ncbi:OmpA family protein [Amycolatopsis sp. WQ 127309]|uniref:OmpA family protein n=1 Tax=Amycolatopsis sp. WQ 127309 TaxID=2932773 RepID=UPI001FF2ACEF|nr:OmpA family protein [Amycolatopsis sp. WQ 127309]UOZ11333.1 OmpA family protein [Amycolatopsis sp. WQ 127309]
MAVVLPALVACGSGSDAVAPVAAQTGQCQAAGPLAVAAGGRAGSPQPILPEQVGRIVQAAVATVPDHTEGPKVSVVSVDGRPEATATATFYSDANNTPNLDNDRAGFVRKFATAVSSVRAKVAEADVLGALAVAARATGDGAGTVVLVDSGLQTVAPLDFRQPGLLDADPGEVAGALGDAVPDLRHKTVLLAGIGDTAAPQEPLDTARHSQLTELYKAIAKAGKADCVAVLPEPHNGVAPTGVPPVGAVPVPLPDNLDLDQSAKLVLPDDGKVGFQPDRAEFRDAAAAGEVIAPVARWLAARSSRGVRLTGTTARTGDREGQTALADARANAVAGLLVERGARREQVATVGVGSYFDGYVPDHNPDGSLIPAAAARNRTVIVEVTHR